MGVLMGSFYVADVTLFDGARVRAHQGVLVRGDRIVWVGSHARAPGDAAAARAVDGEGRTLTPGLIDCHVHLAMDGSADFAGEGSALTPVRATLKSTANLRRHLEAGVTSVRDLGGPTSCEVARAVDDGLIPGPRVVAAGLALTITGGHGHNVGFAREVDGADGVRKAVREEIRAGASAIKVVATGGVLTPGIDATFTAFTPEEIGAAVDEAHKWGRRVAAHAIGAPGVLGSVQAGVDGVEHCHQLTQEAAREMVARGTFRGPTLCAGRGIVDHPASVPSYAVEKARGLHDDSMRSLRRALRAGVRHVVSTDAGTPYNPHGSAAREIAYLVEWGMSPLHAMVAATAHGAENLGLRDVGRVAPGYLADLAMWDANPVEDPGALAKPRAVWKAGVRV
ncbi:MAG TPA: amidohydrolase family protein [Actinomycetota bacterium]